MILDLLQLAKTSNILPNLYAVLKYIAIDDQLSTKPLLTYHLHRKKLRDRHKKNLFLVSEHYELLSMLLPWLVFQNLPTKTLMTHRLTQILIESHWD